MIEKKGKNKGPVKGKCKRALILSGGGARGAYQVGVWKYLVEQGWHPDLICGSSVGALNATLGACDYNPQDLIQLWKTIERRSVYRLSLWQQIKYLFSRRGFVPFMDTEPLQALLSQYFKVDTLRKSKIEVIITAVNIITAELRFFNNQEITIDHLMASSAIPILFPWHYIDNEPHWDGGVMMNTPLLPALERKAREIIVVLLSPIGSTKNTPMRLPQSRLEAMGYLLEQQLIGSYNSLLALMNWVSTTKIKQKLLKTIMRKPIVKNKTKIMTVAPDQMLGLTSILNFSPGKVSHLTHQGYSDAANQLKGFLNNGKQQIKKGK